MQYILHYIIIIIYLIKTKSHFLVLSSFPV